MSVLFTQRFDALHEVAAQAAGFDDFGAANYHLGMRVLLDALDDRPALGPQQQAAAEAKIVSALIGRLYAEAGWRTNPAFKDQKIERPVIVLGLPRTGTTALHQLLSLDPQFQGLQRWIAPNPMPRPPQETWQGHPRRGIAVREVQRRRDLAPEIAAAHALEADDTDECLVVMAQSFICNLFPSVLDIPAYDGWFRSKDDAPAFRRHRDVLKLVGIGDDRRWLLKNPSHLFSVEAMLSVFPDACIVQTHRHPANALSSLFSLLGGIRELDEGSALNRARMEAREISFWAEAARRGIAAQVARPESFINVRQDEIRKNPMQVVELIYNHFSLPLSVQAAARMREWASKNRSQETSSHRYEMSCNAGLIDEVFRPYIERYGL